MLVSTALGEPSGIFHILSHVAVDIALFFIFDGHQASEILPMQFLHHLRDFGNASAQQYIHFAARGLDIFEMHQFQARTQLADASTVS